MKPLKKHISLVIRYYDQPLMLAFQIKALAALHSDVKAYLHIVIVDDGSPRPAYDTLLSMDAGVLAATPALNLYRIMVDVPWNQEAATNVGVANVETEFLLHLDIDHVAPQGTLWNLITKPHNTDTVYLFQRAWSDGRTRTMAPGLWFLSKALFDKAGGLEERFAGRYLPSDRDFMQRIERRAEGKVQVLKDVLIVHDESEIADASALLGAPHIVGPDGEALYDQILANRGDGPPLRMTYPWEKVL